MENPAEVDDLSSESPGGGFAQEPVPRAVIEQILELARRAPSGVNTQPWHVFVLQGRSRAALVGLASAVVPGLFDDAAGQAAFWEQFNRHPGLGDWPAQGPQQAGDEFLSAALAAGAGDRAQARADLARYFRFFDAPVGLVFTISRSLGLGSVLDYGMFLQNIALAARARGVRTCVQTGWKGLADIVLPSLAAPEDALVLCGMALGYNDATQAPVSLPATAPPVASFTTWHG